MQNTYNLTLLAPVFQSSSGGTWGADDTGDATRRQESFLLYDFAPWARANFGISPTEPNWLIGLSRSGYGAVDLLLRNPATFQRAAAWDFPAEWQWDTLGGYFTQGIGTNYDSPQGTQANFEANYRLMVPDSSGTFSLGGLYSPFLSAHASPFVSSARLWISGDVGSPLFQTPRPR